MAHHVQSLVRWCPFALLLLVLTVVGAAPPQLVSAPDAASIRNEDDPYRLDRSVLPYQYNLRLEPNLDAATFQGEVDILVTAKAAVKKITLHALEIEFETVQVTHIDDETSQNNLYESEEFRLVAFELVDIHLTNELVPEEKYVISIKYKGILRDDMYGFYVSTYINGDETKKLAATQFQATHARKAFPCFDEPSYKARFKITVVTPPGFHSLSNMPVETTSDLEGGFMEYRFKNSMDMSSYLVAFVVSDFERRDDEDNDSEDVRFTTWARANALGASDYSLEVSRSMLKVLEDYTTLPYKDITLENPLDKVDQVALPDFAAGAMENWGLITYRETALLYNDGPADAKKYVAMVIAHELLHMWFGNLVTTYWWDTTWLNEGFARYFQYFITDKVETTWRMWDQFLVDQHQSVSALDSLVTAKALTHNVSTPAEVSATFGSITYNKGASVLRMISYIIGPDNFQSALQDYIKLRQYSTVTPQDLFDALKKYAETGKLSDEDFETLLRTWTEQPGLPVVNVTRNYESNSATLSQKRFLYKEDESEEHEYIVPITWTQEGNDFQIPKPQHYLFPNSAPLVVAEMPPKSCWVIFNVQETGYYRVNYDSRNWELLSQHLNDLSNDLDDIHVLNRAQLLDDSFNLARAGLLPYETALGLANYLTRESDYVPWSAALVAVAYMDRMLVNHDKYPAFKRYVLRLLDKRYEYYGFTVPTAHDEKLLLNKLATWACKLDHKKCNEAAAEALQAYIDSNSIVSADLRSVVYCYGIRSLGDQYWEAMWKKYVESQDDVERGLIVAGLSCSSDENRLQQLLRETISGGAIRKQDADTVFSAVYANPLGVDVALEFLHQNFDDILSYYGTLRGINDIVTGIAGLLTTQEQKEKFADFVQSHESRLGDIGTSALAIVEDNMKWVSSYQEDIFSILSNKELEDHRLPSTVTPNHYILQFEPDLQTKTFTGKMYILITSNVPTETITLHSQGIVVTSISVKLNIVIGEIYHSHSYDEDLQFLKIYLTEPLIPNVEYPLYMEFKGTLRDDMYGFYVSQYTDDDDNERKLAATQFQPTHARKAFPCFDEPGFKSTFSVHITTPPYYHALGNMGTWYAFIGDDFSSETQFRATPKMSTYLLAVVVSDFKYAEDKQFGNDRVIRTWARPNALPWAEYSLQVTRSIFDTLERYTGSNYTDPTLNYPFDKVDQVALPDFSAGAMENWGLITYRETALLYNDGSASARKSVATIIAHELAHMWFGNLVTTHWWDTTWLNEGFAQYLMFYATSKVKTDWRLMDQFLVDHHQAVFTSDSLASSHALTAPAYTPAQVSARFSSVTYSKGAAILRMLSNIMGEDMFQKALQLYLRRNRYNATTPDDLFEMLTLHAGETGLNARQFNGLLRSWTEQPGFPVITVRRDDQYTQVVITQNRFLLKKSTTEDPTLYYVPLTWVVQGEDFSIRKPQSYLMDITREVGLSIYPESEKWIIFNVQSLGFYRVNYDDRNWELLSNYLNDPNNPLDGIHVLNRAQLLDDAFNLARAGELPYKIPFDIADYLSRETDYVPWASAFAAFSYLQRMLIYNENYILFQNYVRHLIEDRYLHFNFEDRDAHIEKLLLNRVSAWACSLDHSHCTKAASDSLHNFLDLRILVPADLRSVVYCYGIRHSNNDYWEKLLAEYEKSLDNAERALLMSGLACSNDEDMLEKLLQYSIAGTFIRKQDASSVFSSVYGNAKGVEVALNFLDENFDAVEKYYGSMGAINNIVVGIAGRLTTQEQRTKMENFAEKHRDSLGTTADAALETTDENIQWLEENEKAILDILAEWEGRR